MTRQINPLNDRGAIRLQFSVKGKRYSLYTGGRWDDPDDRSRGEILARQIEGDLKTGNFDPTLQKYGGGLRQIQKNLDDAQERMKELRAQESRATLGHLWPLYRDFKAKSLKHSTIALDYDRRVGGILSKLPTLSLSRAGEIQDWIVAHHPPEQARRILTQLSACCKWALRRGEIETNPFAGLSAQIHLPKEESDINPFTIEERDRIIEAFEGSHYQALVRFLFFTGCRPNEALALQWGDIRGRRLTFKRSWVLGVEGGRLKTQKKRVILLSSMATEILVWASVQNLNNTEGDLIFSAPKRGGHIDWHNFQNRDWKAAMGRCPDIEYRPPYQMRHSFITWRLAEGDSVQDVAAYVGNSPGTIYKFYAGLTRDYCPD